MCLLPRPNLGPGSAGLQVHRLQAADPQEVPQAHQDRLQHRAGWPFFESPPPLYQFLIDYLKAIGRREVQ